MITPLHGNWIGTKCEATMNKEKTGNSGLEVSAIGPSCFGLAFGYGPATNKTFEHGVNFFEVSGRRKT